MSGDDLVELEVDLGEDAERVRVAAREAGESVEQFLQAAIRERLAEVARGES